MLRKLLLLFGLMFLGRTGTQHVTYISRVKSDDGTVFSANNSGRCLCVGAELRGAVQRLRVLQREIDGTSTVDDMPIWVQQFMEVEKLCPAPNFETWFNSLGIKNRFAESVWTLVQGETSSEYCRRETAVRRAVVRGNRPIIVVLSRGSGYTGTSSVGIRAATTRWWYAGVRAQGTKG